MQKTSASPSSSQNRKGANGRGWENLSLGGKIMLSRKNHNGVIRLQQKEGEKRLETKKQSGEQNKKDLIWNPRKNEKSVSLRGDSGVGAFGGI